MKLKTKKQKKNRLLIIDGDIIAFQGVTNQAHMKEVRTKDEEFYHMLGMKDVKGEIKSRLHILKGLLKATDIIIVFGGKGNFRKKVLPTYKSNRSPYKPLGYWELVKWIRDEYPSVSVDGFEADDVMGMLHTGPDLVSGAETVMVSNDKDMRQIPGLLYDHTKQLVKPIMITKEEAFHWSMVQAIAGDATDGYEGIKGYGPVKAGKVIDQAIADCGYDAKKVFLSHIVPLYEQNGMSKLDALAQMRVSRICMREDIQVQPDGSWKHTLWGEDIFSTKGKSMKKLVKMKLRKMR